MKDTFLIVGVAAGVLVGAWKAATILTYGPRNAWAMLRYDRRKRGSLRVGDRAPDALLTALDGTPVHLSERIGGKPLILIFGSYT